MNQNEQGVLYPFRLSGSRMRQSAVQLRRQGQVLDALALVRRAAEQDDSPSAWQALAADMRNLGNWEAAARLLARVLSREPHQPGAWLDMARCMRELEQPALAVDCAYHQLHEDPWSPDGDAARAMLAELENIQDMREPRRTQRMIHRGLTAWQTGDRAAGERRVRRALRIAAEKERLLVTSAMLCMLEGDVGAALGYLARALRLPRQMPDARTLTAISTVYQQLGKRRMARSFLQQAAKCPQRTAAEDSFLTTAWAQDAWPELQEYLAQRMKKLPYRLALLSAKATMLYENDQYDGARQLWREMASIDPEDRLAVTMAAQRQEESAGFLHLSGLLTRPQRKKQLTEFRMAAESLSAAELLQTGSRTRRLTDWMLESSDPGESSAAMELLGGRTEAEMIPFLKELLCRPFLRSEVRQWALVRLAEMGCREEMLMMAGSSYTMVQCQPLSEQKRQQPWRMFLPTLLEETRQYRQSNEIAGFAASLWQRMSLQQRMEAVGSKRYVWCKAMEILYLRMAGEEELAVQVAERTPMSARRISRVLRRLAKCIMDEPVRE